MESARPPQTLSAAATEKKPLFGFYFLLILGGIAADQFTKLAVADPFRNYHFAFSLPVPQWAMFTVYLAALVLIFFYLSKKFWDMGRQARVAWCLVLAGALSNVGERAVLGYVRDFIPLFGGVLNVADLLILAGVAVLLYRELRLSRSSGKV